MKTKKKIKKQTKECRLKNCGFKKNRFLKKIFSYFVDLTAGDFNKFNCSCIYFESASLTTFSTVSLRTSIARYL